MKWDWDIDESAIRFFHDGKYRGKILLREIPKEKKVQVADFLIRILNSFIEGGKKEVICEKDTKFFYRVECVTCGEVIKIYELGFTDCPCGNTRAELKVELENLKDKENDPGNT